VFSEQFLGDLKPEALSGYLHYVDDRFRLEADVRDLTVKPFLNLVSTYADRLLIQINNFDSPSITYISR
jgi:hypothetical protein